MSAIKTSLFLFILMTALAITACQPAEGPAERAGKQIDKTATELGQDVKQAGEKVKDAAEEAANKATK
jgi:predicted small secreted protein